MSRPATKQLSREMLCFHRLYCEKISRRFRALHHDTLSQAEYLLMSIIVERGPVTMTELCEHAMMLKQQVNKTVNQLEEKGLARRERSTVNRRMVLVHATDAAIDLQQDIIRAATEELSRIFGQLDDAALEDFLAAMRTVNGILEKFPVGKG